MTVRKSWRSKSGIYGCTKSIYARSISLRSVPLGTVRAPFFSKYAISSGPILDGSGLMNRGSSAGEDFFGKLPKNGARDSFVNGVKGNVGRPLICDVIDKRRCESE